LIRKSKKEDEYKEKYLQGLVERIPDLYTSKKCKLIILLFIILNTTIFINEVQKYLLKKYKENL
jgi:hypothetical protein